MSYVINSLPVFGYLIFFAYLYFTILKYQNSIVNKYPKDASKLLGIEKVWGINRKTGLLFLWNNKIKNLIKDDYDLLMLHKRCVLSFWIFVTLLFLLPFIDIFSLIIR